MPSWWISAARLGVASILLVLAAACGDAGADSPVSEPVPTPEGLAARAEQHATALIELDGKATWEALTEECQKDSTPGQVTDYLAWRRLQLREQTGVDLVDVTFALGEPIVDGAIGRIETVFSTGDAAADDVLASAEQQASPWVWDGAEWRNPNCNFRP